MTAEYLYVSMQPSNQRRDRLENLAGETEREGEGWKVKLIVFVGEHADQGMCKHSTTT
jgi:hypothetical protein